MAGRGPAPKDPEARRRRNADPVPTTRVKADAVKRGPELPTGIVWPDATVRWWDNWRTSPQAQTFTSTDWDFLTDTALLHAKLWSGESGVASELRLRVAKFGATPEDRARLRLQVEQDDEGTALSDAPPAAAARSSASRRERLLKAVGDGTGG